MPSRITSDAAASALPNDDDAAAVVKRHSTSKIVLAPLNEPSHKPRQERVLTL